MFTTLFSLCKMTDMTLGFCSDGINLILIDRAVSIVFVIKISYKSDWIKKISLHGAIPSELSSLSTLTWYIVLLILLTHTDCRLLSSQTSCTHIYNRSTHVAWWIRAWGKEFSMSLWVRAILFRVGKFHCHSDQFHPKKQKQQQSK